MKRVAVFGNAGGGKSTLARQLAELTQLPWYPLDRIQFKDGGHAVSQAEYLQAHTEILQQDTWIIDGYGSVASAWERFAAADTLIYIDLPLATHYWRVTKRFFQGHFTTPQGWPAGSPIWSSTYSSYRVIGLCHRQLTPRYRQLVAEQAATKRIHHLRSPGEVAAFLEAIRREYERR
ncbi:MAG: adenylate kinase [Hyphomicrobiaceae bacterium]